jgi:type II secretory pathway pseudopilin PulG
MPDDPERESVTGDNPDATQQSPPSPHIERDEDGEGGNRQGSGNHVTQDQDKPLHWTRYVEVACAILLVLITGTYTYYSSQQATAAITAANAAKSSSDTATAAFETSDSDFQRTMSQMIYQTTAQVQSAQAAKAGIKAAQQQMRLDQRAWVGVKSVSTWVDEHGKIGADMLIDNTGKTPALDVRASENIEPLADQGLWHEKPEYPKDYADSRFTPTDSRQVVAPNESFHVFVSINGVWGEGLTDTLHGRIAYDDVFGCQHWIIFCYSEGTNSKTGPFWTPCSIHNDIDMTTDELRCKSRVNNSDHSREQNSNKASHVVARRIP